MIISMIVEAVSVVRKGWVRKERKVLVSGGEEGKGRNISRVLLEAPQDKDLV